MTSFDEMRKIINAEIENRKATKASLAKHVRWGIETAIALSEKATNEQEVFGDIFQVLSNIEELCRWLEVEVSHADKADKPRGINIIGQATAYRSVVEKFSELFPEVE
jgi:hypothetical protein